ncbi:PQQ-dependent sugar dehydrogenase [Hyalangium versicolor]|uniref:PQQ-dependent sugar dehydrogenase n=1 Tax=Hyalangium versicolor TaxID=2861190 RepID=UPI001CCE1BDB|nr:PQQ-dependent sugar dehydrogenase [Hyalangium versicolor]
MNRRTQRVLWKDLLGVSTLFWVAACGAGAVTESPTPKPEVAAIFAGEPLVSAQSGRCLDVVQESRTPGTGLQIYGCHGRINQAFTFTTAGELRTYDNTLCVDTASGQTAQGTRAVIATCTGLPAQKWVFNANGTVVHTASGLCLDVEGALTTDETPIIIWACNGQTNQKWSRPVPSDTQAPTPPSNLVTSNLTCNSVTLSWTGSTDNVGVAFYDIYHDGQQMKSVDGSTLSTSLTVVPGATWGLYVNARDAAGNVSQASPTLTVTPPQCQADTTPPTAPTQLSGSAFGTSVTLTWNASTDNVGVTGYDVLRNSAKIGTATGTTFLDSGLAASTAYTYTAVARDAQGNVSTASNALTLTTGAACTNPICSVTQVATDTDIPWGLVPLADGTVLYSRRDAQDIVRLNPATGVKTTLGTVPNVQSTDGEGGLLGLAVAPTFDTDRWLYIMHTSPTDNRIVRIKVTANFTLDLASEQVLVQGLVRNKFHNGGRLRWGPDGKLYASTGDGQNGANSQNTSNLAGKVLRINPDGSIPSDNPFGNLVWSYGHRNPQGLAFDSSGQLWEQEFGNSVMDETNLIVKGGNYGWPDCEGTVSQSGSGCATPGYIAPKQTYSTAEGSCSGIAVVRDVLYVACQRGTRLYREVISGSSLTNVTQYFVGTYGRLRTVEPSVDGNLWLTTSNSGDKDSIPNNSNEKLFRVLLGN